MQILYFYYPIIVFIFSKLNKLKDKEQIQLYLLFICLFIFCVLSFFDMNSVPDVEYYNDAFDTLTKVSISAYEKGTAYEFEYGYLLFVKLVGFFSSDPRFLYIVRAFFSIFVFYYIIKKYSPNIYITGIVFLMFAGNIWQASFVIRQYMAIFIFLLAIPSLLEKRPRKYFFITFCSYMFHDAAIVYFPLYLVYHYVPIRKFSFKLTTFIIVLLASSAFTVMKTITSFLGIFQNYYEAEEGLGSFGMALRAFAVLFPIMILYKKAVNDDFGRFCLITASISIILSFGMWGVGSGSRLFEFYNYFSIFSLPWCFVNVKMRIYKSLFLIAYITLFSFLFFKDYETLGAIHFMWE